MPLDSFLTDAPPDPTPDLFWWDAQHCYGPVIRPVVDVLLFGVRAWRHGQEASDDTTRYSAWVDGDTDPLGVIELAGPAPTADGWREYLFRSPRLLAAGTDYQIAVGMTRDEVSANSPGFFPAGQMSRAGMIELVVPGRWAWQPPDPYAPPAIADTVWHWIDPLVDVPPPPPDPDALPADRTTTIAAERRTTTIPAESRALTIPHESRTLEVPA